jgi:hypothetical protein
MSRNILFVFLLLSSFLSCKNKESVHQVMDKTTYKNVLKEIILSNITNNEISPHYTIDYDLLQLVYNKYGIDSLMLKKTTDYYSRQPEVLEQIYQEIHTEIKKIKDSLEKLKPKPAPKSDSVKIKKSILLELPEKIQKKENNCSFCFPYFNNQN